MNKKIALCITLQLITINCFGMQEIISLQKKEGEKKYSAWCTVYKIKKIKGSPSARTFIIPNHKKKIWENFGGLSRTDWRMIGTETVPKKNITDTYSGAYGYPCGYSVCTFNGTPERLLKGIKKGTPEAICLIALIEFKNSGKDHAEMAFNEKTNLYEMQKKEIE